MADNLNYAISQASVLRRGDWWGRAIDHTIRQTLMDRTNGADANSFPSLIARRLDYRDLAYISRRLAGLQEAGEVLANGGRLHLAETARQAISAASADQKAVLREVESHYERLRADTAGGESCPPWAEFQADILNPLITELGAHTVELMNGLPTAGSRPILDKYLVSNDMQQHALAEIGLRFFDPQNESVRKHVFTELQSYFLAASRSLDKEALEQLTDGKVPTFKLLLDTNAVFSVLDLHINPANEATAYLLELKDAIADYATVQFYVLQETLEEARSALDRAREECSESIRTPAQAQSLDDEPHASGLIDKYKQIARESPVTAETYFSETATYLQVACEGAGVRVVEQASIKEGADFRARVNDWLSWQEGRRNPRTRGAITHDLRCLTYVASQRKSGSVTVVAEAEWWLLTVDQRLRNFERANIAGNRGVPCAIAPDELTQVLQFWSPRPEELDQALIVGMRLPFSFYDYDNATQATSLQILKALNQFEGADQLSADATRRILVDKAVRDAFDDSEATEAQRRELVKSAAVLELQRSEATVAALKGQVAELSRDQSGQASTSTRKRDFSIEIEQSKKELLRKLEKEQRENSKLRQRLKDEASRHRDEEGALRGEVTDLQREVGETRESRRLHERLPLLLSLLLGLSLIVGCAFLTKELTWQYPGRWWRLGLGVLIGSALAMALTPNIAWWLGVRSEWAVLTFFRKHRGAAWISLAAMLGGAVVQFALAPPE